MTTLILEPDNYSSSAIELYKQLGHVWLENAPEGQEKEVKLLVVRLGYYLDEKFLAAYPNLQVIITPTTGLTHIEPGICKKRNIRLFSLADCREAIDLITSTSELTLGLMISLLRGIHQAHNSVVNDGKWQRDRFRSRQLSSLTLGIVGLGRVGGHLAHYAKAMGMRVLATDPYQPDSRFNLLQAEKMTLGDLLGNVDILSIHANYSTDNYRLIGGKEIDKLSNTALIINTARGELLDEEAALNALRMNRLGGVAVDVLDDELGENKISNSPMIKAAREGLNVLVTPHIGGCTSDAMHITENKMAELVIKVLSG